MKKSGKISGLYAIIDTALVGPDKIEKTAKKIMKGGGRIIQLRSKDSGDLSSKEFLNAAKILKKLTVKYNATFIVNDRVDIALISGADGVHLGQEDLPPRIARKLLGKNKIVGLSTHTMAEAFRAGKLARKGLLDYISFGPVFPTKTKKDARKAAGTAKLEKVKKSVNLPVVAIGGIKEENLPKVLKTGVDSVAMISGMLESEDIQSKISSISAAIKSLTS